MDTRVVDLVGHDGAATNLGNVALAEVCAALIAIPVPPQREFDIATRPKPHPTALPENGDARRSFQPPAQWTGHDQIRRAACLGTGPLDNL